MFDFIDYSDWQLYDGFSDGSGRSEKHWLQSANGEIGLFKYPKIDPVTKTQTFEHISEHLAHQIGNIVNVETARVELGMYNGRQGSISYLVNGDKEELREGLWFILGKHPLYDPNLMQDLDTGAYYSVDLLFEIANHEMIFEFWYRMILFDFLIGNTDRHQSNWAFLLPFEDINKQIIRIRPCPLYDNGSSLCCYIKDDEIQKYLGNDKVKFSSLVETKSRTIIRINRFNKQRPKHSEMVRYLFKNYPNSRYIANMFVDELPESRITDLIQLYPDRIINTERKILLQKFLTEKINILSKLILESEKDE